MSAHEEDSTVYTVVVNHEEQYIKDVWTDMRPLSLRKRMDDGDGTGH